MKQHPDSVNRDLDDEIADAIEHQYARKLIKGVAASDGERTDGPKPPKPATDAKSDEDFDGKTGGSREPTGS